MQNIPSWDDWELQFLSVAIFLIIFGGYMNILFILFQSDDSRAYETVI